VGLVAQTPASPYVGGRTLKWLKVMRRPHYREGASGWEPSSGVATAAQHNQVQRDRPFPGAESPNRSGQDADMGRWEPGRERPEEDPELYRGSLYEPPYSIGEAAVGFTVIVIGSLLSRWLWGQ
jgi:hypothetical protein